MKVYVVIQGEYSNYRIEAIFRKKKDADGYIKDSTDGPYEIPSVEIWDLFKNYKKVSMPLGYQTFRIYMTRDGTVSDYSDRVANTEELAVEFISEVEGGLKATRIVVVCRAKNKEHAIKITNEHRVQFIAENKWGI